MTSEPHITFSPETKDAIREAIPFPELAGRLLGDLQRAGGLYVLSCPFHDERTSSFTIYADHAYCFGCCRSWDHFALWMEVHSCDFPSAVTSLAALAGVTVPGTVAECTRYSKTEWKGRKYRITEESGSAETPAGGKPVVPPMRRLKNEDISALSRLRGIDPLAIRAAAHDFCRVGMCDWPQWQRRDGRWMPGRNMGPAWVVTDGSRRCFDFRRMDGGEYEIRQGSFCKCWTQGTKKWAIGCEDIGERVNVAFTEGGPDHLAAFHFLRGWGLLDTVAVCGVLGSGYIAEECLPFFRGKRVRIFMQADRAKGPANKPELMAAGEAEIAKRGAFHPDDDVHRPGLPVVPKGWKVPSMQAAAKWQKQLTDAGAAVEVFSLYGYRLAEPLPWKAAGESVVGDRVGDLNDLIFSGIETLSGEAVQEAFFDWDF